MVDFIEWLRTLIIQYPTFQYLVIFIGAAFGGELAMITLGFLSAQGMFSLNALFIVSFFGTMSSDILYFLIGRSKLANKLFSHRYAEGTISMITAAVEKISRGSHFVALLLANFMLASRIILILYVSKTNLKFWRFFYYEAIALVLWLLVLIPIGFLSGLGFTYFSEILENAYAAFGFLLMILLGVIIVQLWLKRFFTKEGEEILEEK